MPKRTLYYSVILIIILAILATLGVIYYKDKNSLKAINIKDVKAVKLFPFQGANPAKEYSYNTKNSKDIKVINDIVIYLNKGKSFGIEKRVFALQGGTPPRLVLELTNGQNIEISTTGALADQVLVTQSNTNRTFKIFSPELRKLFTDELKSSSLQPVPSSSSTDDQKTLIKTNDNYDITSIDFISQNDGFMIFNTPNSKMLLKTTNGGYNWSVIIKNTDLVNIFAVNNQVIYGLENNSNSEYTTLEKTVDGGTHWTTINTIKKSGSNIQAIGDNLLFVGTNRSTDGGKTWSQVSLPSPDSHEALDLIYWLSAARGYALFGYVAGITQSEAKTLYYTEDGGKTWSLKSRSNTIPSNNPKDNPNTVGNLSLIGYSCNGLIFFSDGTGYLSMRNMGISKTIDGGVHFSWVTEQGSVIINMDMINNTVGYTCINTLSGIVLESTLDGGKNWKTITAIDKIIEQVGA